MFDSHYDRVRNQYPHRDHVGCTRCDRPEVIREWFDPSTDQTVDSDGGMIFDYGNVCNRCLGEQG